MRDCRSESVLRNQTEFEFQLSHILFVAVGKLRNLFKPNHLQSGIENSIFLRVVVRVQLDGIYVKYLE